ISSSLIRDRMVPASVALAICVALALDLVDARTSAHSPAVRQVTRNRFELGTPDSLVARWSQEGSEYFTGGGGGCARWLIG
ncbi:MAG TPA: hypothetical protein VG434_03715, partial [Sphingomicrobium sp.]|nr:hypothetical protein [Sphingomicrobium sp.]